MVKYGIKLHVWVGVNKDMKKKRCNKGGGSREGSGTFRSNTNYQGSKISVEHGRVVTTLNIIKHSILFCLV
jgi:hypothetical protein